MPFRSEEDWPEGLPEEPPPQEEPPVAALSGGTMARRKRARRTRVSNSSRLFKKRAKCPSVVKRVCKTTKKGQVCQVVAGSYRSKWFSAGVSQRRALNLKARLAKAKGCQPSISTHLGRR
jgi:hypothetical protein